MKRLEVTEKWRAYSEDEAKAFLEEIKAQAAQNGYVVKKNGYEYKTKKSKGEIVDEAWVCTCTKIYNEVWE